MKTSTCFAVLVAISGASSLAAADAFFSESDFGPGSWTALATFTTAPVGNGAAYSAGSGPVATPGGPMRQTFSMNRGADGFNTIQAPIQFSGWAYDPSTQGAVETISASGRTIPQSGSAEGYGAFRLFVLQSGNAYVLQSTGPNAATNYPNFQGHDISDPELVRTASSVVATDFIRIIPDGGFDLNAHPDYAGSVMTFAFGYMMTTTLMVQNTDYQFVVAFDDVSVRITSVPAPGAAALCLGTLAVARRRRTGADHA
jgi:hypothetical protein